MVLVWVLALYIRGFRRVPGGFCAFFCGFLGQSPRPGRPALCLLSSFFGGFGFGLGIRAPSRHPRFSFPARFLLGSRAGSRVKPTRFFVLFALFSQSTTRAERFPRDIHAPSTPGKNPRKYANVLPVSKKSAADNGNSRRIHLDAFSALTPPGGGFLVYSPAGLSFKNAEEKRSISEGSRPASPCGGSAGGFASLPGGRTPSPRAGSPGSRAGASQSGGA